MIKLPQERVSIYALILLIVTAYLFSVGIRMIWINEFSAFPQFHWNNELMINTNDGYVFAEGARDLLRGGHQPNDLSGIDTSLAKLTALLATLVPVSFETLILYMPSLIGSLIVIPLILIGRALGQTGMGFIAALLAGVAHSYYNRTMAGYYDTDMLNVVFPMFEMYSLILALTHQRNRYLILITLSIALYQWWYPQGYALDTALFLMVLGYAAAFDRTNRYLYKIALFILIGILALPVWVKLSMAIAVFALFHYRSALEQKVFWPLFALVVGIYFATGGFDPILALLKGYVFRGSTENTITSSLHFYNVMSTVREAGQIPFSVFAERISGHPVTFILSFVGYIIALIAYRPLLITLPLVGLGFVALVGGLRFTIYAVPIMALGFAFLLLWATQMISKNWLRYTAVAIFTGAALYPNYLHVRDYMTPTVLTAQEVSALEKLGTIADREDYVVAWWDYGYPLRYYSDVKTWIDGGKHNGDVNYPASYVLTTSQDSLAAAHMMRLFTEYTEKSFSEKNKNAPTDFEYMMKSEGFEDPDEFLTALSLPEYKLPAKTRDVYLYLPWRMMEILPTVSLFSNLDLNNPANVPYDPFFYSTGSVQENDTTIELGNNVSILKTKNMLKADQQEIPIKRVFTIGYNNQKKLQIDVQQSATEGLNIIVLGSYGKLLVMDDFFLNSPYVQMFVFERYDPTLFEPVILDPMTKIYRLKK